ncbi:MAG: PHP domain-containing protein [Solirubrobacteraceae bacterium]|nr:PHP domain-containing protein [Solirubrobacteraceae bacterium]
MSVTAPDFDLQSHSHHSDGALAPAEVVARAGQAGIRVLALSDHDTVDGVAEALAAGDEHGVEVVTAVELSSVDPAGEDLHILGYGIDHEDAGLAEDLARFRADRVGRIGRMADAMEDLGWAVDRVHLDGRAAPGRPHLAEAVYGHPANAQRIADEGLATSVDLLVAYLIPGARGFRGRSMPTVSEAIEVIQRAGGVAVWAHPFWDIEDPDEVHACLRRFTTAGLDGVEAFYVTHTEAQTRQLAGWADELGLLTTGSADFHGPDHPRFSAFGAFSLYGLTPRIGRLAPSVVDPA